MGLLDKIKKDLEPTLQDIVSQSSRELQGHGGITDSMIALFFSDGHMHTHFPGESDLALRVYEEIKEREGIKEKPKIIQVAQEEKSLADRKIIFGHNRAAGDGLMFSCGIRDFKLLFPEIRINVDSNQSWIWENNPYIDRSLKKGDPDVEYYRVGYPMIGSANNTAMHFTVMFLFDMIAVADLHNKLPIGLGEFCAAFANGTVGDPPLGDLKKHEAIAKEPFIGLREKYKNLCEKFVRQRGDLHLSEEEKKKNIIKDIYGVDKYWVIAPGGKRDATTKIWDWRKFQEVVDYFEGKLKFVVIGRSDHVIEDIRGTINYVDKTENIRDLVPLVYHADGCVSGPSLLMHLAASVPARYGSERKPCVTILGGREPSAWTWYCNHQMLHTNGIFKCCDNGGCWKARTHPLPKDPKHNDNLCLNTVQSDGRTIQACMEIITAQDVIRSIEKYYQGDIYTYSKNITDVKPYEIVSTPISREETIQILEVQRKNNDGLSKKINLLGNLNTAGGGEQSLLKIAEVLGQANWDVRLFPWGSIHKNYKELKFKNVEIMSCNFKEDNGETMTRHMFPQSPLLFYGNDCVWDFCKSAELIVNDCSELIVGINYMLGHFKDPAINSWLAESGKLKAVVFQNDEKKEEWEKKVVGFEDTKLITLFGAIDIDKFYEVCPPQRNKNEPLIILKHSVADYRKYVTKDSVGKGDKIHIWQKNLDKELDIKFYNRLLKDTKDVTFMFMEAHNEIENEFKNNNRMIFYKWDELPVTEFMSKGHAYLYRSSNLWRDNYPRVVAEALAAGLPVLSEPRDGTKDRIQYGDTGFYCIDYDGYLYAIKLLQRKEKYRQQMSQYAKDWAKKNLDPKRWVNVIEDILGV